jgi:hypothetical protein
MKQECETLMADLDNAPTFPKRAELHRTLTALKAADKVAYNAIAKAGRKLAATMAKGDFLALDGRCAALADKLGPLNKGVVTTRLRKRIHAILHRDHCPIPA